jgi:hypothetical protein
MITITKGLFDFYISRLRRNYPGYFREFWPYISLSVIASYLDFLTTWHYMKEGGVTDEFHPAIRLVAVITGPLIGPIIGKLSQLLALILLTVSFREAARIIFIPIIIIYLYGAWYNTWGINIYTPLFLKLFS